MHARFRIQQLTSTPNSMHAQCTRHAQRVISCSHSARPAIRPFTCADAAVFTQYPYRARPRTSPPCAAAESAVVSAYSTHPRLSA